MGLPDKYKTALYLYYYEGYNSADIAKMLKKPASTIRNYLMEARKIMKERLGDDFDAE
jgi:RNA polymerase sigma-70 factor (ECF subfamily)